MDSKVLWSMDMNFFSDSSFKNYIDNNSRLRIFRGQHCNMLFDLDLDECYMCIYQASCLKRMFDEMKEDKEVIKTYFDYYKDPCDSIAREECSSFSCFSDECDLCRKIFQKEFLIKYVGLTDSVKEYLDEIGLEYKQEEIKSEETKVKNFEKHIDGLLDAIYNDRFCSFAEDVAKIPFSCNADTCDDWKEHVRNWLLSDYKPEPVVDWSKVPVNTPVYISFGEDLPELRRYFAFYEDGKCFAFCEGRTSWSIPDDTDFEEYKRNKEYREDEMYIVECYSCRLAREEDIKKYTI